MSVKIDTNIPIVGTPKVAYLTKSQYGDKLQLKLRGKWDGTDQSDVFLNQACLAQAQELGFLRVVAGDPEQDDPDHVKLRIEGTPRIQILRTGSGPDTRTTITLAGGAAPTGDTRPSSNGAAAPSPNGRGPAQGGQSGRESPGVVFQRLKATMAACLREARVIAAAKVDGGAPLDQEAARTIGLTLFIECCRRDALAPAPEQKGQGAPAPQPQQPPPITDGQKYTIDQLGARLGWATAELEAEICRAAGATNAWALTEPQARLAIRALEEAVQKEEAAARAKEESEVPF